MAEKKIDYALTTLCVPLHFARSVDPDAVVDVKAVRGRRTKEELEKLGYVPLGRHPQPDVPGMMTISDPQVDRHNDTVQARNEKRRMAGAEKAKAAAGKA